jgi:hypothetical protein
MTIADPAGTGGSSSTSHEFRDEMSNDASRLAESVRQRASEQAEVQKGQATGAAKSVSSALEKAAGELEQDDGAPDWLGNAFRQAARQVESFSNEVDGRSAEDISRQVSSFARQNPTAFLAASAAVGFAAARFLRAGSQHHMSHQSGGGGSGSTGSFGGYGEGGFDGSTSPGSYDSAGGGGGAANYGGASGSGNYASNYAGAGAGGGAYAATNIAGAPTDGDRREGPTSGTSGAGTTRGGAYSSDGGLP